MILHLDGFVYLRLICTGIFVVFVIVGIFGLVTLIFV